MNIQRLFIDYLAREWLLAASAVGLLVSSLYLSRLPVYSPDEVDSIFLLFSLFIAVKGVEHSGFLCRIGLSLEQGRYLPVKLVLITFVLSMIVTIDVSLVTIIPLVMSLNIRQRDQLVILVALTAHAGAALTPFGTPQNLFIFAAYDVAPDRFVRAIAPFSLGMLSVFLVYALFMPTTKVRERETLRNATVLRDAIVYGLLLGLVVLCVLRVLPAGVALSAAAYALLFDRKTLKVDYALLATFLCFIGLADNISHTLSASIDHIGHVFVLSAVTSQFISNVPTTLLLTNFTNQWEALLWGTNVGGFGSLMGALANLITYRLYVTHGNGNDSGAFLTKFILFGYIAFIIGMGIYFAGLGGLAD